MNDYEKEQEPESFLTALLTGFAMLVALGSVLIFLVSAELFMESL